MDPSNWCHHSPYILKQGRTVWWTPEKEEEIADVSRYKCFNQHCVHLKLYNLIFLAESLICRLKRILLKLRGKYKKKNFLIARRYFL